MPISAFLVRVARLELTATSCGARNSLLSLSLGEFRPLRLSLLAVSATGGARTTGYVFLTETGQAYADHSYRASFYECLESLEISAPEGKKLTPHCCRHTFATLVKKINAPDKDKLELIGHTSIEMLQHYTHVNTDDLRKITDKI